MVGIGIEIIIDDLLASEGLARIEAAAENMTPLMEDIGAVLVNAAQERIEVTNVGPDGVPWPQSYRAREEGGPTLLDTSRLRDSIASDPSADSVRVGTNVIYGRIHQLGGEIVPINANALVFNVGGKKVVTKRVVMPARPYLGVSDEDRGDVQDIALMYFETAARGVQ